MQRPARPFTKRSPYTRPTTQARDAPQHVAAQEPEHQHDRHVGHGHGMHRTGAARPVCDNAPAPERTAPVVPTLAASLPDARAICTAPARCSNAHRPKDSKRTDAVRVQRGVSCLGKKRGLVYLPRPSVGTETFPTEIHTPERRRAVPRPRPCDGEGCLR